MNFEWHLQTAINTTTKMVVASRAVTMAVMAETRRVEELADGRDGSKFCVDKVLGLTGQVQGWRREGLA